ncbi:hypothetical protein GLW08_19455 [Pontibacillus yanchengensis]|uniref:Uncharacterized protein n=1 Tax=Pontibacillus yanchengensis TaxID=462910 RepID=A0ACC7VMA3_9BACI|nr:hypothetical protein [Pontibacillus yanchengensis]MYL55489.1 hypothetical protein [Pontibacillus yanchengensis]
MASTYADVSKYDWLQELEKPEVQESLTYLIKKLPDIQQAMDSVDHLVQFGQSVTKDQDAIQQLEERITYSTLNEENIEAMIKLLGKMPMLFEMVERLEQMIVFVESVLGDRESLDSLYRSMSEQPVLQQGKDVLDKLDTIKEKAESTPQENISIFAVLKWMKDPNVQKSLHYIQTALDVFNKKD